MPRGLRELLVHLPAGLSGLRLLAAPGLVRLARRSARGQWCTAVAMLVALDLADGILARRIGHAAALRRQRALDGLADAVLDAVVPVGACQLRPELLRQERVPLAVLAAAQAASVLACAAKFRRLPRYHTVLFKWSAGSLGVALAGRVAGGRLSVAFRPAVAVVALAHLEALAITLVLDHYEQPVPTVGAVLGRDQARPRLRPPTADARRPGGAAWRGMAEWRRATR